MAEKNFLEGRMLVNPALWDEESAFLYDVASFLPDYTGSQARRW